MVIKYSTFKGKMIWGHMGLVLLQSKNLHLNITSPPYHFGALKGLNVTAIAAYSKIHKSFRAASLCTKTPS